MDYIILISLVLLSGLFSGLTIGLMGLSISEVKRASSLGNDYATKVMGVIKDQNLLLVTLLLGNTAVNSTLSIFMGTIVGEGLVAGVVATATILIFGEILPASILSKHALYVGAKTSTLVKLLMFTFYIFTKPIAYILDKFIGVSEDSFFSKKEFLYIIDDHLKSSKSDIDELDNRTLKGSLLLSSKKVGDHMSSKMFTLSPSDKVSDVMEEIKESGFTRIPIFKNRTVVGILNVKNLLGISNGTIGDFMTSRVVSVDAEDKLDDVLSLLLNNHTHMAIVSSYNSVVGIITQEDIIEEILLQEIEDEFSKKT